MGVRGSHENECVLEEVMRASGCVRGSHESEWVLEEVMRTSGC